jgi:citrate lyase subunit beta/citryl-CoA lyase/(S)-citramalyl-CoA lyase
MFAANSLIFVPGSRPERFERARSSGAGLAVIDLEDAVGPADKDTARAQALAEAAANPTGLAIRINGVMTAAGICDLAALLGAEVLPQLLMVPMVESAVELEVIARALGERCPDLIPLVETPKGLRAALVIATAPRVCAVMFGGADFSGELGVQLSWEPLLAARAALVLACAEARVPAIDVPFINLDNMDGLAEECERAKALGFAAKAAIHPTQISFIETAFTPSAAEVAEAEAAIAAYDEAGGKAIRYKGKMLEAPLIKRYRAVLSRKGQQDA